MYVHVRDSGVITPRQATPSIHVSDSCNVGVSILKVWVGLAGAENEQ